MSACPKCSSAMEAGFIPDFTYGTILPSSWVEGVPEKNWRGLIKTRDRRNIAITAERCTGCGFLEMYARA